MRKKTIKIRAQDMNNDLPAMVTSDIKQAYDFIHNLYFNIVQPEGMIYGTETGKILSTKLLTVLDNLQDLSNLDLSDT